jgi:signal recognition particle GTPase
VTAHPKVTLVVGVNGVGKTTTVGKLANLPSNGAPYALMVFAGLLPWLFFSA